MPIAPDQRARALAALLAIAGTSHFLIPKQFDAIVPPIIPGSSRMWTYVSGVAELTCAALVARSSTRRLGGWLAALLFVAVFPGNVQMAIDWSDRAFLPRAASLLRLPLQIPLVLWARRVARDAST